MRMQSLSLGLLLSFFLWGAGWAIPIQVENSSSLKVSSGEETLFEVSPLDEPSLQKLLQWLDSPPAKVSVRAENSIILGLPVKLSVSPDIARRWNSEPKVLAAMFSERLNHALSDREPNWSVDGQVVPLSESRVVRLSPFPAEDRIVVSAADPTLLEVADEGNGRYRLSGLAPGRTELVAGSGSGRSIPSLPISVKPWAARWGDGPGELEFWGPVDQARVERSLSRWLGARMWTGAGLSLESVDSKEEKPGYRFQARATGPGTLPVEKTLEIAVKNRPASPLPRAKVVVLSNHPERIISDGILFSRVVNKVPFRFMWHHRNDPEGPERYLVLKLENPTDVTRRLRMLWYSYGPSPDEIHVGHTAALDFSQAGVLGKGEELILPARGSRTVEIRYMKPGQTVSGMALVTDLTGAPGPLGVEVLATVGGGPLPTEAALEKDLGRTASGVFPADIELDATHLLGGPFTYLEFGGEPYEKDIEQGHPSYGNFGTVYRVRLTLKNPHMEPREATVGFASGGGAARGVLSLDRTLFDLPMGITGDGLPVQTYTLGPGEVRQVDLELFPQAGSNYPVRVVVKSQFERLEKAEVEPLYPLETAIP